MTDPFEYKGVLAPYMNALIRMKESCGFKILSTKWFFKEFDEFTIKQELTAPVISRELIDEWSKSRTNDCSRTFYGKCSKLSQLTRYMNEHGEKSYIMPLPECKNDRGYVPYIFSEKQICSIFEESDQLLRESHRMDDPIISIPCLIRLLYSTGLRISEAISLKNRNVDLDRNILRIGIGGSSKNGEERIVPICESLKKVICQYLRYRNRLPLKGIADDNHLFFVKLDGTEVSSACAYKWFRKIYTCCGIAYKGEQFGPRVHDLRHSMATHSLSKVLSQGMDVYTALPLLSACLGHKHITATEVYVRLTCDAYPDLLEMCSSLNDFIYPKENKNEERE
jgi:integrase